MEGVKLLRYIVFVLLVLGIELGILFGVSFYFDINLLSTMFFGSSLFIIFAFIISTSGDVLTKNAELGAFYSQGGAYKPRHEKMTLKIGPFLVGSILCLVVYFILTYFMG